MIHYGQPGVHTTGGGGDFVVLRASGADDYNDYIFGLCHCDSVETIVLERGAGTADPFVIDTIRKAEALFIGGGDQSNYVRYWQGTPVQAAINHVAAKPAPVGGTSASYLGGFVGVNLGWIDPSSASGNVTGNGSNNIVGGFVGANFGSIDSSTASGNASKSNAMP